MNNGTKLMTAGVAAAATAGLVNRAHPAGSDVMRVGLLGCGGRGTGAAKHCLHADPGVELVAVADLFESKARGAVNGVKRDKPIADRVKVKDDMIFSGFDCYEKLAAADLDIILMATPPAFRPRQLMAAIKAGKHVFTEKPVAVDVVGCREIIEAARLADQKGLSIVAGTQRRHEFSRLETLKRIHDGQIGELVGGQCYWFGGGIWYRDNQPQDNISELEWQCHNWYHFTWISGDQVCEQHIHNIDMLNWGFNGPPKTITALGGRCWRDHSSQAKKVAQRYGSSDWKKYDGDIWDHLHAEFEYPNGARCLSLSGHGPGKYGVGEKIVGTKGTSDLNKKIDGENAWSYKGKNVNGQQQEHINMIQGIRKGELLNEGVRIAESTLTAIGARIAGYTGRTISWDWLMKKSQYSIVPPQEQLVAGEGIFHDVASGGEKLV